MSSFKIDEGVELFEEIMMKVQEANSDNQREKYQVFEYFFMYIVFAG